MITVSYCNVYLSYCTSNEKGSIIITVVCYGNLLHNKCELQNSCKNEDGIQWHVFPQFYYKSCFQDTKSLM